MTDERIGPSQEEGDDVPETRSPDAIQKEIEQTRAELAETIDAIADRISPRRAASRGAAAVKAQVSGVLGNGNGAAIRGGPAPASVLDAPPRAAAQIDAQQRQREVRAIAASGGGSAYTGTAAYTVKRTLRTDRVLIVVGVASAVAALVILRRSRR